MSNEPQDTIVVDTLDQKVLLDILSELQAQGRTMKKVNRAVQIISLIMFLSVLLGCILGALAGPAMFLP